MGYYELLGKINTKPLEADFGKLQTDEIVVTGERSEHIKIRHWEDFNLFCKYGADTVINPDVIIKEVRRVGTVYMVKKLPDVNLNVIVRLALATDEAGLKNSVMTFYRIREKNLIKLENKNKVIYKRE